MPDSTLATLSNIRTKIRRLTRSPSSAQLSDALIDEYVNTFVLYDFPEHLRLFNLREVFTWYCSPYIDTYETNNTAAGNPFENFKNRYISVHPPCYVAGYQALFTQSREQLFSIYPKINQINQIGTGDGSTTVFTGTLSSIPVLANQVLFSSIDSSDNGLQLVDSPIVDGTTGLPTTLGTLYNPYDSAVNAGSIDYVTGAFTATFATPPASGQAVNIQVVPYVPSLPQAVMFYEGKFTLRPIPDQPYRIDIEAYVRPTELLSAGQQPELAEWWQYLAYGAARKVFQDRMDMESLQMIEPEFKKQEALINRRTIVQNTNNRVATIYTEQSGFSGSGWGYGGGSF